MRRTAVDDSGTQLKREVSPIVGLMPTIPFACTVRVVSGTLRTAVGDEIEPQVSVPIVSKASARSAATPLPELDPPGSCRG